MELSDMNTQVWASFGVSRKIYECLSERQLLQLSNGVAAGRGSTHGLCCCCDLSSLLRQLPLHPHFLNSFFPFFTLLLKFFLSLYFLSYSFLMRFLCTCLPPHLSLSFSVYVSCVHHREHSLSHLLTLSKTAPCWSAWPFLKTQTHSYCLEPVNPSIVEFQYRRWTDLGRRWQRLIGATHLPSD